MAQAMAVQPNIEYRRPTSELSRMRAEMVRAAVEKQAPVQAEAPRQAVLPPQEDELPAISRDSIASAKFYRRVAKEDVMLSGNALVVNEAYIKARANKAMDQVAEQTAQADIRAVQAPQSAEAAQPSTGCATCEARTYQDGSDDSGVSFQSATGMSSSLSGVRVAAHEGEHVTRESTSAREQGDIITDKHVTMQMRFCPDCGRMYAAGGKTTIQKVSRGGEDGVVVENAADALGVGEQVDSYI